MTEARLHPILAKGRIEALRTFLKKRGEACKRCRHLFETTGLRYPSCTFLEKER
jgi:hypothetical protein